jgi:hypothetical protein
MGDQHHAPAGLSPRKTRYPLQRRLGGHKNEYQEYFLGCKSDLCPRLKNLTKSQLIFMKSGSLALLEHSGHVQASTGTTVLYFKLNSQ